MDACLFLVSGDLCGVVLRGVTLYSKELKAKLKALKTYF